MTRVTKAALLNLPEPKPKALRKMLGIPVDKDARFTIRKFNAWDRNNIWDPVIIELAIAVHNPEDAIGFHERMVQFVYNPLPGRAFTVPKFAMVHPFNDSDPTIFDLEISIPHAPDAREFWNRMCEYFRQEGVAWDITDDMPEESMTLHHEEGLPSMLSTPVRTV